MTPDCRRVSGISRQSFIMAEMGVGIMSEVNYRRNGMKYSTTGRCWGMAPKAGGFALDLPAKGPKPKSSRERRAAKKRK